MKKLPKLPWLLAIPLLLAVGVGFFFWQRLSAVKTIDNLPVMLINNGKTAVYQELKISKGRLESQIVVSNTTDESQKTKVYEYIPKEIAPKASDLTFDVQPQILEDDPLIMWDLGPLDGRRPKKVVFTVKLKTETTQCVEKGYFTDVAKYGLNPMNFDDCSKYFGIKFEEAMERNKKLREEKEKDRVQLIKPGEGQYKTIRTTAKAVINPPAPSPLRVFNNLSPKISKEEAVAKVQAGYAETVVMECVASWNSQGGYYQVVCNRQNYSPYAGKTVEFNYTFYTVFKDGKANKIGNYYKESDKAALGKPMWGVQ